MGTRKMDFATKYEICSPGVIAEDFDGDIVILNLEDGRYFSLRGAGPSVWSALMAGVTPESIVESARQLRSDWAESTNQFLHRLRELELIRVASGKLTVADPAPVVWGTAADGEEPGIDVFDDLAELILADPIHDVDADVGWPARKAA